MRDSRNHLSHEYPDNPELTAINLNVAYGLSTKLINNLNKFVAACEKI